MQKILSAIDQVGAKWGLLEFGQSREARVLGERYHVILRYYVIIITTTLKRFSQPNFLLFD